MRKVWMKPKNGSTAPKSYLLHLQSRTPPHRNLTTGKEGPLRVMPMHPPQRGLIERFWVKAKPPPSQTRMPPTKYPTRMPKRRNECGSCENWACILPRGPFSRPPLIRDFFVHLCQNVHLKLHQPQLNLIELRESDKGLNLWDLTFQQQILLRVISKHENMGTELYKAIFSVKLESTSIMLPYTKPKGSTSARDSHLISLVK